MEPTTQNQTTVANSTPATSSFDKKQLITPIAIIIAGIFIAIGISYSGNTTNNNGKNIFNNALQANAPEIPKITGSDHIRGSKDAPIVIIEYSDIECPFCKGYHQTMKKIYDEYGKDNNVAWVYRHFPLSYGAQALHKNAAKEAEATECAAEVGGEDLFWKYIDIIYETTQSNDGLDLSTLPSLAEKAGLDKERMKECIDSGKYATKIKESYDSGIKAGASATPYTVIQYKGEMVPLVNEQGQSLGALPYEVMKKIVDNMLASK